MRTKLSLPRWMALSVYSDGPAILQTKAAAFVWFVIVPSLAIDLAFFAHYIVERFTVHLWFAVVWMAIHSTVLMLVVTRRYTAALWGYFLFYGVLIYTRFISFHLTEAEPTLLMAPESALAFSALVIILCGYFTESNRLLWVVVATAAIFTGAMISLEADTPSVTFTVATGLVFVVFPALFANYLATHSRELFRAREETERLMRETHHRVKNNLTNLAAILNMQANAHPDPALQEQLRLSLVRIHNTATLHALLTEQDDMKEVDIDSYLRRVVDTAIQTMGTGSAEPDAHLELDGGRVTSKEASSIGIIVTELVSNTLKHGCTPQVCKLDIKVWRHGRHLTVRYQDSSSLEPGSITSLDDFPQGGIGFTLVEALVKDHQGTVTANNADGLTIQITIPLVPSGVGRTA